MNILFLTRLYYPHIGGVEKHVRGLSKILVSRGHKIKLITTKHDKKLKDFEVLDDVEVYRMPVMDKWGTWKWMAGHHHLIKWADIVHAHDVYYWYVPFFWMKKSFVTFHGWEGIYPIPWKNIFVRKISEKLASGNICVGDFISKWYKTSPDFVTYGAA